MPAGRARAVFEPIPPNFDLRALVEGTDHFQYVDRISCDMIDQQGMEAFDKLVLLHVIIGGKPLIIDGYQGRLDEWTFSSKWLQDNHGDKVEHARNITKKEALPLTIRHYLKNMSKLTDQYFEEPDNYRDKDRQRIYLKDIDCPPVWVDKLREQLPPNLFYYNESSGEVEGPGADEEVVPGRGKRRGRGIASAGDLMSSLPAPMRAENMMCYIGHEGTYTPAHREMCASLGHNIMVESSEGVGDEGKPEKPGSSIWFMTESKDRQTVSEYWLSILGHDIEVETHFAEVAAWKKAPFPVYVAEQRAGDFLLIPPLAPHQVWNRGTRTMKVAWNRTTVETLEMAINEALPRARQVCRDEQYKNKAIIYYTLHKYYGLLIKVRDLVRTAPSAQEQTTLRKSAKIRQLEKDYKRLFKLFRGILLSEMFAPETPHERNVQFNSFDSNITCAYCRGNIFNRFLTCPSCDDLLGTSEPEPYDICMDCYAMGRSCGCISKMRWAEQFKWKELVEKYETWRRLYVELDNRNEEPPRSLQDERGQLKTHTLAQICQYQLKRRPWVDVHKPEEVRDASESGEDEQIEIGEDGTVKKKRKEKKRTDAWLKNNRPCHVCCHRHPRWKMAECPCGRSWCYGTLFRGHDMMPQQVMENPNWRCPHCEGICSAGNCKKKGHNQKPYEPKGTLLGHDTRAVADVRSVESLVDFSVSNLNWLKESKETPADTVRLRKHQEAAHRAKLNDPALSGHLYATDDEGQAVDGADDPRAGIEYSPDNGAIDPQLAGGGGALQARSHNPAYIDPALIGGADSTNQSSYQSARQNGFIAPAALMYNGQNQETNDMDDDMYPDPDNVESTTPSGAKKRTHEQDDDFGDIITTTKKKRRDERQSFPPGKPVSGATKQYRKDHERRALEEARRNGRYIQVSAALKGKRKLVRLHISRDRLLRLRNSWSGRDNDNVVISSDIMPPEKLQGGGNAGFKTAKDKRVRIRTEQDADFATRARDRKKRNDEYEDIDLESDQDNQESTQIDGALETTDAGKKKRRLSSWQARRQQEQDGSDEEEDPERTKSKNQTKQTAPRDGNGRFGGKGVPHTRPTVHFAGEISSDNEQDGSSDSDEQGAATIHRSTAAAALRQQDENRKVKLEPAGSLDGEDDEESEPSDANVKSVAMSTKQHSSVLSRKGPGGRKIKIVSSSTRRRTTGPGGVANPSMAKGSGNAANSSP